MRKIDRTYRLSNGTWLIPDPAECPEYYSNLKGTIEQAKHNPDTGIKQAGKSRKVSAHEVEIEFDDSEIPQKKRFSIF